MSRLKIALIGYGTVGKAFYQASLSLPWDIVGVATQTTRSHNDRSIPFTTQWRQLLDENLVDLVVELISDSQEALSIARYCAQYNLPYVTANKKLLAENASELFGYTGRWNLGIEGSVCGGIPLINNLLDYYNQWTIQGVEAIVNGSVNHILSELSKGDSDFPTALAEAQSLGYAESNPSLDVDGWDSVFKLCILARVLFGVSPDPAEVVRYGVSNIPDPFIKELNEKGLCLKLPIVLKQVDNAVTGYVIPTVFLKSHPLGALPGVQNQVIVNTNNGFQHTLGGPGAGGEATAQAVLADVERLKNGQNRAFLSTGNQWVRPEVPLYQFLKKANWQKVGEALTDANGFFFTVHESAEATFFQSSINSHQPQLINAE